jgi:hypothetical protein
MVESLRLHGSLYNCRPSLKWNGGYFLDFTGKYDRIYKEKSSSSRNTASKCKYDKKGIDLQLQRHIWLSASVCDCVAPCVFGVHLFMCAALCVGVCLVFIFACM